MLIGSLLRSFDLTRQSPHRVFLNILKYFSHSLYELQGFSQTNSASSRQQKELQKD